MRWLLRDSLQFVEPYVPSALVAPQMSATIRSLVALLPNAMAYGGFECYLASDTARTDFLACVTAANGGRVAMAAQSSSEMSHECVMRHPVWRRLRDFCAHWATPSSLLYHRLPFIWLEFDLDRPLSGIPLPSLLTCLAPEMGPRSPARPPLCDLNAQTFQGLTETILNLLLDAPLAPEVKQNLLTCFEKLPPGGRVLHLSLMLPRGLHVVKLNISLPKTQLLHYLAEVQWGGSSTVLDGLVNDFGQEMEQMKIDLTIGETIKPKVGLEFFGNRPRLDQPEGRSWLEKWVQNGLCAPAKQEALLAWPGEAPVIYPGQEWPVQLVRTVDFKINIAPDRPPEAKAYLGFGPHFSLV